MPKFFHLTRQTKTKTKTKIIFFYSFNFKIFNAMVFCGVIIIFFAYLIQVNSLATKGYVISELEKELATIEQEHSNLEARVLSLQMPDTIKEKINNLQMVATKQVDYLKVASPVVAYK